MYIVIKNILNTNEKTLWVVVWDTSVCVCEVIKILILYNLTVPT